VTKQIISTAVGIHFTWQIKETKSMVEKNYPAKPVVNCVLSWSLWTMIFLLLVYCYRNKKAKPIYYKLLQNIFMLRMWVPCLDLSGICKTNIQLPIKKQYDLFYHNLLIMLFQVFFNMNNSYWISIP